MIIIKSEWCVLNKFKTASLLCCYKGITPMIRASGSSLSGRARISKVGTRKLQ
ncbi:transposase [Cellulophaga sp. Z1A5H]|uniref:transposase n=1 Tax=Cellulophaga sp. Z1A5H TaxID=2687291 RepID=UPI0013FD148B|nr:transposase [Cellulophaga sp. Z1A5H]